MPGGDGTSPGASERTFFYAVILGRRWFLAEFDLNTDVKRMDCPIPMDDNPNRRHSAPWTGADETKE